MDFNKTKKHMKKEIDTNIIKERYEDMLSSILYAISSTFMSFSFENAINFLLNVNNTKKDAKYKQIDAIKQLAPNPNNIEDFASRPLKIIARTTESSAINEDANTLRKVCKYELELTKKGISAL